MAQRAVSSCRLFDLWLSTLLRVAGAGILKRREKFRRQTRIRAEKESRLFPSSRVSLGRSLNTKQINWRTRHAVYFNLFGLERFSAALVLFTGGSKFC